MKQKMVVCLLLGFLLTGVHSYGQSVDSVSDKLIGFPSRLLGRIESKTTNLNKQLTEQTEKYLQKMAKREERLKKKLYKIDSTAAKDLFANSGEQYAALAQKMRQDTGSKGQSFSGEYQPYTDSLRGTLNFLQQNPQLLGNGGAPTSGGTGLNASGMTQLQSSAAQLQALQAKMQDADQAKAYIQQRKQQIGDYINQHANLAGILGKQFQGLKQDQLYYSQQVQQYKEMLNNPDQLEQKALSLLNQLPAFQNFMKNNSQLAGLFNLPGNYGSAQGLVGLQTRDQVNNLIQGQIAAGGSGGAAALQSNLQSAESQLDGYKDKLSKLGSGSGDKIGRAHV